MAFSVFVCGICMLKGGKEREQWNDTFLGCLWILEEELVGEGGGSHLRMVQEDATKNISLKTASNIYLTGVGEGSRWK